MPLDALTDDEHGHPLYRSLEPRDRTLLRAILMTALRFRATIGKLVAERLERPLPANAHALSHLLHIAAAQILFLNIPDSAAVDLAVSHASNDPRSARFAGLVNAVLRSLSRTKQADLPRVLATTVDAPVWFEERLIKAYGGARAAAILAMHRIEAPVDFTVKGEPGRWAGELGGMELPNGTVRVERPGARIADLPGYKQGAWWVQDAAASLPARLLGPVDGQRVGDLCAAPGGKSAQLAASGGIVTAIDMSASRLRRLHANLVRLGLTVEEVQADILHYRPNELFDAVLLDAPCSSTGTIRRHPDIAWTKSPADIDKLAGLQRSLLDQAATMVRPGGRIVFSNCSLDPLEGEILYGDFLADHPEFVNDPIRIEEIAGLGVVVSPQGTLRTTPADLDLGSPALSGLDGFFAARMRRLH